MGEYTVFQIGHYDKFKCIGSECKDTCCAGWNIWVDKEHYKYYRSKKNQFYDKLNDKLIINEECEDENDYGMFLLDDDQRCSLLNSKNLCNLFINEGEESLCRTCTIFPRIVNEYAEGMIEKNLDAGCPVAAEYLVKDKDGISISEAECTELNDRDKQALVKWCDGKEGIDDYYIKVRQSYISIIKDYESNIEDKFFSIMEYQENIQQLIEKSVDEDDYAELGKVIEQENNKIRELKISEFKEEKRYNYGSIINILNEVLSEEFYMSEKFEDIINMLIQFLSVNCEFDQHKIREKVREFEVYFKERKYIFDNYVTYDIFKNYMGTIIDLDGKKAVYLMIISTSILKLIFTSEYVSYGFVSDERASEVISSYEKYFQQDFIRDLIYEYIVEENTVPLQ